MKEENIVKEIADLFITTFEEGTKSIEQTGDNIFGTILNAILHLIYDGYTANGNNHWTEFRYKFIIPNPTPVFYVLIGTKIIGKTMVISIYKNDDELITSSREIDHDFNVGDGWIDLDLFAGNVLQFIRDRYSNFDCSK